MGIVELEKPRGQWCPHVVLGKGCAIYDERPNSCREFSCLWLLDRNLGDEWKPEKCKMVLSADEARKSTMVYIEPSMPEAWKRAPYFQRLVTLMQAGLPQGRMVFIVVGDSTGVLLPDAAGAVALQDLGKVSAKDEVSVTRFGYPHATRYEASVKRHAPG
jgi:hypothetical protein